MLGLRGVVMRVYIHNETNEDQTVTYLGYEYKVQAKKTLTLDCIPGTYVYVRPGIFRETMNHKALVTYDRRELHIIPERYTVIVKVVDLESGKPIGGATVRLYNRESHTGTTDSSGKVQFKVKRGDYTLEVYKEGYEPLTHRITVSKDVQVTVKLKRKPIPTPPRPPIPVEWVVVGVAAAVVAGVIAYFLSR